MNFFERLQKALHSSGDDIVAWMVFILCSGVGASALGMGVYLRNGGALTVRAVAGVLLHSLMWGIVIFLLGYSTLRDNIPMLLGLSILSGIGTASAIDVVLMLVKMKLGINVTVTPPPKP